MASLTPTFYKGSTEQNFFKKKNYMQWYTLKFAFSLLLDSLVKVSGNYLCLAIWHGTPETWDNLQCVGSVWGTEVEKRKIMSGP